MASEISIDPSTVHDVQVARLDADMFNADDIDGGTEGLTGSGNLNYLVLQSSQTNETGQNANPFDFQNSNFNPDGTAPGAMAGMSVPGQDSRAINPSDFSHNGDSSTGFLNTSSQHNDNHFSNASETNNNNANTALNSLIHSSTFDSSNKFSNTETNNLFPGDDGLDGNNGDNGNDGNSHNGSDGNNGTGTNGHDGKDGHSPDLPPDTTVDSHIGVHVVSDILNANLDLLVNPVGNLVGGINVDVTGILGDILSPNDGLLPHPGVILDGIIGDNHILNDTGIGPLLVQTENAVDTTVDHVNTIATDLLPGVPNVLGTVGGILNQVNGDSGLFVTSDLKLPFIGGLGGLGDLSAHVPLTPVENIIGLNNIHLSLNTDQSGLISDGLHLNPVEIGLTSTGGILPGLDTGITTDNLVGSTVGTAQDVVETLTQNHDIIGNLTPDAANILPNAVDEVSNLLHPATHAIQTIASGDILGTINTGEVADTVHDTLGFLPFDQIPGGEALETGVNNLVDQVTQGITPVTDSITDILHGATDPLADIVGNIVGDQLADNLTDTLHGIVDNIPVGSIVDTVTEATAPVADLVHDLASGEATESTNQILPSDIQDTISSLLDTTTHAADPVISLLQPDASQSSMPDLSLVNNSPIGDILSNMTDTSSSSAAWPEATVSSVADVIAPVTGSLPATLPDPVGVISEGLNLVHDAGGALTGGLHGSTGHHGLLG